MRALQLAALGSAAACAWLAFGTLTRAGLSTGLAAGVAAGVVLALPPVLAALLVGALFTAPKDSRGRAARRAATLVVLVPLQVAGWYAIDTWWAPSTAETPVARAADVPAADAAPAVPAAAALPGPAPHEPPAPRPPAGPLLEKSYWGDTVGVREVRAPDGALYVSGTTSQSLWFGRGGAREALRASNEPGQHMGFVARFSARRELDWVRRVQSASLGETSLAVFPDGDVVALVPASSESAVDTGEDTFEAGRHRDPQEHKSQAVLVRYDRGGALRFRAQLAHGTQVSPGGVALAPSGDAYVWYNFSKRLTLYRGAEATAVEGPWVDRPGVRTYLGATAVIRLRSDGSVAWARALTNEPLMAAVAAALPSGGLFLAGRRDQRPPGPGALFFAWLDADGAVARMRGGGGAPELRPAEGKAVGLGLVQAYPVAVAVDSEGAVAVAGSFGGRLELGDEKRALEAPPGSDLFVAIFDAQGRLELADAAGSPGLDFSLASELSFEGGTLEVWGSLEASTTFGKGTPREVVLERKGEAMTPSHAVWRRGAGFVRADHAERPRREALPACCNRESALTVRARRKPWPLADGAPRAPEVAGWVKRALGGVELGWTREDEVEALLPPPAPRHVEAGYAGRWMWLLDVQVPGSAATAKAELHSVHGVAKELLLGFAPGKGPRRDEVRAFFAPLHHVAGEGAEGELDFFCPLAGNRSASVVSNVGKDGRVTRLVLEGRTAPCSSDEQLKRDGAFLRQHRR